MTERLPLPALTSLLLALLTTLPLTAATISERVLLLDGSETMPADIPDRELILAFPGIGGAPERSLFVQLRWEHGAVAGTPALRAWQQQQNLQPGQIGRQQQTAVVESFSRGGDGAVSGKMRLTVESPKQAQQDAVRETFAVEFTLARKPGAAAPDLRPDYSSPSWRRLDLPLSGAQLVGTVHGSAEKTVGTGAPVQRAIDQPAYGADQPVLRPDGPWSGAGDGQLELAATPDGLHLDALLATRPTEIGEGPWRRRLWAQRRDLSRCNALLISYVCAATAPARLGISLEESPGLWYGADLPVTAGARTALIPFTGLSQRSGFDMDLWFTPSAVGGLGLAVTSGYGAGAVRLTIRRIEAVRADGDELDGRGSGEAPTAPVTVVVAVDRLRTVNGSGDVPDGLFGAHAVDLPIDEHAAATLAALKDSGVRSLRLLEHSGFDPWRSAPPRREAITLAAACGGTTADNLVECWTWGLFSPPTWVDGVTPVAQRLGVFAAGLAGYAWSPEHPERSLRRFEVLNEPFMWARHINKPGGRLQDPTQHGSLPAKLCADAYAALFIAAADGAKAVNPHLQLGGPCCAGLGSDDWRHLTQFALPVVAACGKRLDFLAEHHYQGRGQQYAAEYEVFQAAAMAQEGRRIPIWNTECNDLADTPGADEQPIGYVPAGASRRRAAYQLSEILEHLRFGPDHTRGRAVHALWKGAFAKVGEAAAFKLMRVLRGALLPATSSDDTVQVAACRDTAAAGSAGGVVVYNDGPFPRTIVLPGLARFAVRRQTLGFDPTSDVTLTDADLVPGDGELRVEVPALGAVALTLANLPATQRIQAETVRYATTIVDGRHQGALWTVKPGETLTFSVADAKPQPTAVRVVAESLGSGEAKLILGAVTVALPRSDLGPLRILTVLLPPGAEVSAPRLEAAADSDGFRLDALGFVWNSDQPAGRSGE